MHFKILNFANLVVILLSGVSLNAFGYSYREWDFDHPIYRHSKTVEKHAELSAYQSDIATFDERLQKMKNRRDRLKPGSAHYIDLDQSVKELATRIQIAKHEIAALGKTSPSTLDTLNSTLNREVAEIQAEFDRMQAE